MYTFYYHPGACSMAAHILLEECGADYEAKHINLAKGEQRDPEYLAINPRGKVPALVVDGQLVSENPALLPFIADLFPEQNLLPADPLARAQCVRFASWCSSQVHITYSAFVRPERYIGPGHSAEVMDRAREYGGELFWNCLTEIDAMLAGKTWLMGDQYTVIDPYAFTFYSWGYGKDLPVADLKNYTAHKDRLFERPAVRKILGEEGNPLAEAA